MLECVVEHCPKSKSRLGKRAFRNRERILHTPASPVSTLSQAAHELRDEAAKLVAENATLACAHAAAHAAALEAAEGARAVRARADDAVDAAARDAAAAEWRRERDANARLHLELSKVLLLGLTGPLLAKAHRHDDGGKTTDEEDTASVITRRRSKKGPEIARTGGERLRRGRTVREVDTADVPTTGFAIRYRQVFERHISRDEWTRLSLSLSLSLERESVCIRSRGLLESRP